MDDTLEATASQPKPAKKTKAKARKEEYFYCFGEGNLEAGVKLSAPMAERDAVSQSYRSGVCFYRVQKMKGELGPFEDARIVAVPAK